MTLKYATFHHEKQSSTLQIQFKKSNQSFLRSLVKMKSILTCSIDNTFSKVNILCSSYSSLDEFMERTKKEVGVRCLPYNTILRMIYCLHYQQQVLEIHDLSIYTLSMEDIIVIDEWTFLCVNPNVMRPLMTILSNNNKQIVFSSPFERKTFSSPELLSIKQLPSQISITTFYYSLASLVYFCMFSKEYDETANTKELNTILYTKLYFFFKKALVTDPNDRYLIYI